LKGLRHYEKRQKIFHWAKSFDIIALQETFFTKDLESKLKKEWPGTIFNSYTNSSHSRGVSILINSQVDFELTKCICDGNGRMINLEFRHNNNVFQIINVYMPTDTNERKIAFNYLQNNVDYHANVHQVICGDFNSTYRTEDRLSGNLDNTSSIFREYIYSNKLSDLWVMKNPTKKQFSFISSGNSKLQSRIDYFLSNSKVQMQCKKCYIASAPAPDHKAVVMVMSKQDIQRGKGYWKLNNSVLDLKEYKDGITDIFLNTTVEFKDVQLKSLVWDMCKIRFKEFSIEFCTKLKRNKDTEMHNIESKLDNLDKILADTHLDESRRTTLFTERKTLKSQLDSFYICKSRGSYVRSRANWIENGEKSSKYFLSLERLRQENNTITTLFCSQRDQLVSNMQEMLNAAKVYYEHLYSNTSPNNDDIEHYLDNLRFINNLEDDGKDMCEGKVTLKECTEAVNKNLKKNKSPGLDGLSTEFYQTFWHILGNFLVSVYNESFDQGLLPISIRKSVLGLIFKKGEKELLKNYRPISLTNTDYKILAFVLSNRMHNILDNIISPWQTAYVKKRYIGNNIRFVQDIIEYSNLKKINGCLLFLDFQKAFDSVEWDFMFATLKRFNFGDMFIKWISVLYNKPLATVKLNGCLSTTFELKRGVRQGCPVSALLFLLVVEVMAQDVQQNPQIQGIQLTNSANVDIEVKITQYADDTILYLQNPHNANITLNSLSTFSTLSGLKLNKDKTEGLKFGSSRSTLTSDNIKWVENVKCLGIMIGHNHLCNDTFNWKEKLSKIKNVIHSWKMRDLTQIGKITVIKSLIVSKLNFTLMNVDIIHDYIHKLDKIIFEYIWPTKQWVKRNVITNNYIDGGLNMVDLSAKVEAIEAKRMTRLLQHKESLWASIPMFYLNHKLGLNNYWENIKILDKSLYPDLLKMIPGYYSNALMSYSRLKAILDKQHANTQSDEISLNEPLWLNDKISWCGKPLFFKKWMEAGLIYLKDIVRNKKLNLEKVHFSVCSSNLLIERNIMHNVIRNINTLNVKEVLVEPNIEGSQYYNIFKCENSEKPTLSYWRRILYIPDDIKPLFKNKVVNINEVKLKCFNFKMIHGILIHGYRVNKWDKSISPNCRYCFVKHTIEHMIFECILAKNILKKCAFLCNWQDFNLKDIIYGVENFEKNYMLTFVTFTLYKYWLITSKENVCMSIENANKFFLKELNDQISVLNLTCRDKECSILKKLYDAFILL